MLYHKCLLHPASKEWAIFIHGAGGSSTIWYKQVKEYKKHFNVLLLDLRGHGKSRDLLKAYIKEDYSFESISQDVLEVMDHLKIEKAHFIGISLGTILIRTLAEMAPGRVKSMVLGGAVTRLDLRSRFLVTTGNRLKNILPFIWLYKLFAWIMMPRKSHAESRSLFIKEARKLYKKETKRWFRLVNELNPILKYFHEKELSIPVLYLMGAEDYIFLAPVKKVIQGHKFAFLTVIQNAGHVCNVDQPDTFNRESILFIHRSVGYMSGHKLLSL
jgi:pimeloyl-ACP methyl ester carboxylesterase